MGRESLRNGTTMRRHGTDLRGFANTNLIDHWNENGHFVAGQLLARRICERVSGRGTGSEDSDPHVSDETIH